MISFCPLINEIIIVFILRELTGNKYHNRTYNLNWSKPKMLH